MRPVWLTLAFLVVLATSPAQASQGLLLNQSLQLTPSTAVNMDLQPAAQSQLSSHPGRPWLVLLGALPSLALGGWFTLGQTLVLYASEGGITRFGLLGAWVVVDVGLAALTSVIVFGFSRAAGFKSSYGVMFPLSLAARVAGALIAFIPLLFDDKPPMAALAVPLGLGALVGTGFEVYAGMQHAPDDEKPFVPPAERVPESSSGNMADARPVVRLPLLAFRF